MNRRSLLQQVATGVALATTMPAAMLVTYDTTASASYTARAYFNDMMKAFPDAQVAIYRDSKLVRLQGWSPEYIFARGIEDPWGRFFDDWLEVLNVENHITRIVTVA